MTDDPSRDEPGDDPLKDFSIMSLLNMGGKMYGEFTEDEAIELFLEIHPEADEADVRAELTRELEAIAKKRSPQFTEWLRTGELPKRGQEAE